MVDLADQILDRRERTSANRLVRDQAEETLDLIEPRAIGGNEVHVPAGPCGEPGTHLRMRMCGVVVHDAVDVQLDRHRLVDGAQKRQELLVAMVRLALGEHSTVEHIEGRKQRRRPVAHVVVRHAFDVTQAQCKHRLRALQRLTLALLVHAQHQRVVWRAQVQPNHVTQLLDEERVGGQFEVFAAMRLQAEHLEVAMHAGLGDTCFFGHRAHAPVRRAIGWLCVQHRVDQAGQSLIVDRTGLADACLAVQTIDATLDELGAPLANGAGVDLLDQSGTAH